LQNILIQEYQIKMFDVYLHHQTNKIKHTTMKTFEIKTWLSENREVVIEEYNKLAAERFFNGISLKDFMVEVLNAMIRNNVKDEKKAKRILPILMGNIYVNNSKIEVGNNRDAKLANKYRGTAFMAMV
jgi:hypothetical protein